MTSRTCGGWLAGFAFAAALCAPLSSVLPANLGTLGTPPVLRPSSSPQPLPHPTLVPIVHPSFGPTPPPTRRLHRRYAGAVRGGTRVPLAMLPMLPVRTSMNTATPPKTSHGRHFHPFAATGAQLTLAPDTSANTACNNATTSDNFNQGCDLGWQATSLNNFASGDTFQDYYVPPNSTTATATASGNSSATNGACTSPAGGPGNPYTNNTGQQECNVLGTSGLYTFGTYDVTKQEWVSVAYAQAGQNFAIGVYADPFHTQSTYQFDAWSSAAAYIYLPNATPGDTYVVYVMSTSTTPYCAFISPAANPTPIPGPTPTGTAQKLLCDPSKSAGTIANNGGLSVTWPLNNTIPAGTYSIVVFDKTADLAVGQTQVALTGGQDLPITLAPSGLNGNTTPGPSASPATAQVFAWDNANEASVGSIVTTMNNLSSNANHHYLWTFNDPNGQAINGNAGGSYQQNCGASPCSTMTQTFRISTLTSLAGGGAGGPMSPGQYPSDSWAVQLYDQTSKTLLSAQAFQVVGYSTSTVFNTSATCSGTTTTSLQIAQGGGTSTNCLTFTNNSNLNFPGAADNVTEIVFSSGPDFTPANNCCGIIMWPDANVGTECVARPCSPASPTTVTDSAGNPWNATYVCWVQSPQKQECTITLTPQTVGVALQPGGFINVPNVTFTNNANPSSCASNVGCELLTFELPQHGVTFSNASVSTGGSANAAFTPVFIGGTTSNAATASFQIYGSVISGTQNGPATPSPFVGTHYYKGRFAQADYQNNSPYSVTNANKSIWAITINNAAGSSTITQFGIQIPWTLVQPVPACPNSTSLCVDKTSTNGGTGTCVNGGPCWTVSGGNPSCGNGYSTQWFCFQTAGGNPGIVGGSSQAIYLDVPMPPQSYSFTDLQIQSLINGGSGAAFGMTAASSGIATIDNLWSVDSLAIGAYSLNSSLMTTSFQPSTVGTGLSPTPLSIQFTNTSSAQDALPDAVDAIVIEATGTGANNWTVNGSPTLSATGWSYLGTQTVNATTQDYWFGLCPSQYLTPSTNGPPSSTGHTTPLTAPYPTMAPCTLPESNALTQGKSTTINMSLNNFGSAAGTVSFNMFAHGANENGWSAAKPFSLTVNSEAASVNFSAVNGTAVSTGSLVTISGSPNTYKYKVLNNSSAGKNIGTVVVALPGTDTNGLPDSTGAPWSLVAPIASTITLSSDNAAGGNPFGCSVDTNAAHTFSATEAGANGQITVSGCALPPNDDLYVTFQASGPQTASSSWIFPATLDPSTIAPLAGGVSAGTAWIGSNEVTVSLTIGLTVTVNPASNGNTSPAVVCPTCTFAGSTINFNSVSGNSVVVGQDVARASVIMQTTNPGKTWTLYVQSSSNPATTKNGGTPAQTGANELQTAVDNTRICTHCGGGNVTYAQTSYAVMPTSSMLQLVTGPETAQTSAYEILQNYMIATGIEVQNGAVATITYTLIAQ